MQFKGFTEPSKKTPKKPETMTEYVHWKRLTTPRQTNPNKICSMYMTSPCSPSLSPQKSN